MDRLSLTAVVTAALMLVACGVNQEKHDDVVQELEDTKIELAETERAKAELEDKLTTEIETLDERVEAVRSEKKALEDKLEEVNEDLELYETKKGSLEDSLEASREELDELREARKQTEQRLEVYREVAEQLASMIEAGQLSVTIRDGRMVINLDDDILFDSGRTAIRGDGQQALTDLAEVLDEIDDRNFLVAGHTDDIPIQSGRFSSNWELSTARAVEVVEFLQEQDVDPNVLAAAGYGEFDPIASNEDEEGRAQNRRIEIVLMPSIDELPSLPDDVLGES